MKADIRITDNLLCANEVDRDGDLELTVERADDDGEKFLWLTSDEVDRLYELLTRVRLNRQTVEKL